VGVGGGGTDVGVEVGIDSGVGVSVGSITAVGSGVERETTTTGVAVSVGSSSGVGGRVLVGTTTGGGRGVSVGGGGSVARLGGKLAQAETVSARVSKPTMKHGQIFLSNIETSF